MGGSKNGPFGGFHRKADWLGAANERSPYLREVSMIFETNLLTLNGENFNSDSTKALHVLQDLWNTVLCKDKQWHLFYEGKYSTLRFNIKFLKQIEKFLNLCGVTYSKPREWIDNSKYVENYKYMFIEIFHNFSVLAMISPDVEIPHVFDRIVHSYCNHHWYRLKSFREQSDEHHWESQFIAHNVINRAIYEGIRMNTEELLRVSKDIKDET